MNFHNRNKQQDILFHGLILSIIISIIFFSFLIRSNIQERTNKNSYKRLLLKTVDVLNENISKFPAKEKELKPVLDYLNQIKYMVSRDTFSVYEPASGQLILAQPSIKEILEDFRSPEWIKSVSPEIKITQDEYIKLLLSPIQAKIDQLYEEKLTKWDVAIIVFQIITGLAGIITIIISMIRFIPVKKIKKK